MMKVVWEVMVVDKADFDAVLFEGLFSSEWLARKVGDGKLASYRQDCDWEFEDSIILMVVAREVF